MAYDENGKRIRLPAMRKRCKGCGALVRLDAIVCPAGHCPSCELQLELPNG